MKGLFQTINRVSLIKQIIIGLIVGIAMALLAPEAAKSLSLLGTLFVGALKGIAPVLVFFLVLSAISKQKTGEKTGMSTVVLLYVLATFIAAVVAVIVSTYFPTSLHLQAVDVKQAAPEGIIAVLTTLLKNIVDNPVHALLEGNYIGILGWSLMFGFALKHAPEGSKEVFNAISSAVTQVVNWIIHTAPLGIMGLVADAIATNGIDSLLGYLQLLIILLGTMLFVAFIVNPILVAFIIRRNPYPLVFKCIRESGVTAFFTRSSAANIPVNLDLAKRLKLSPDIYSVSIPLGATVNMGGAAITITVMTLAAVHTLGITVDMPTAILLSIIAAVGACGASGVAGGSLLLIPLACSLFGISNDIAMQVVGVGFIIGVLQDSTETALNSSTDILFTAAADYRKRGYRSDWD